MRKIHVSQTLLLAYFTNNRRQIDASWRKVLKSRKWAICTKWAKWCPAGKSLKNARFWVLQNNTLSQNRMGKHMVESGECSK